MLWTYGDELLYSYIIFTDFYSQSLTLIYISTVKLPLLNLYVKNQWWIVMFLKKLVKIASLFRVFLYLPKSVLEIYWVRKPKPSVDPLLVIEANLALARLDFSSIYTLFGSYCNSQAL